MWILSRNPDPARLPAGAEGVRWDAKTTEGWAGLVEQIDFVVNLTGENLGAGRWTAARKKAFYASRVDSGRALAQAVQAAAHRPQAFLQASTVGYYGDSGDQVLSEQSPPGRDYLSRLVVDWEASSREVEAAGVRRVVSRTGIVLGPGAEILKQFKLQNKLFAGGPLGNGRQWIPWIHIDDEVRAIIYLMRHTNADGAFNLTGPYPYRNVDFGRTLSDIMERPFWLPVPAFGLELVFGEMSQIILKGQRALPFRLQELGFQFEHTDLRKVLEGLVEG